MCESPVIRNFIIKNRTHYFKVQLYRKTSMLIHKSIVLVNQIWYNCIEFIDHITILLLFTFDTSFTTIISIGMSIDHLNVNRSDFYKFDFIVPFGLWLSFVVIYLCFYIVVCPFVIFNIQSRFVSLYMSKYFFKYYYSPT